MKRTIGMFIATLGLTASALAEECMIHVPPDRDRGVLGDLIFYSFEPHLELQIDTPTQPSEMSFMVAIDGQETPEVMAFSGLDDMLLSIASASGDIAVDLEFVSSLLAGNELTLLGFRNSSVVTFASYDLAQLRVALAECGLI